MSFNDLDDLEGQPNGPYSDQIQQSSSSPEFTQLSKSISTKLSKITSNVTLVHRYIGLLGTPRDTEKMRSSLMDTLTKTSKLTRDLLPSIRDLSRWDNPEDIGANGRFEQKKLLAEYQKAALDFQNAQRLALEKQKDYVKDVKAIIEEENREEEHSRHLYGQQTQQRLRLQDNSEIEFNEQLIEEREQEILGIEQSILELNEIFKDLATIVTEQGNLLDDIESNVGMIACHTKAAERELRQANRWQKNARKWACWLSLILVIILTAVLLAVLP